jgi:hypothetical protein
MPIKLNCGLSRKVADQNYGSRGASINVEVEVESSLAGNPTALKDRIKRIFGLVRDSLSEELNSAGNSQVRPTGQNAQQPGSGASTGTGNGQKAAPVRAATQSQIRAIGAIAKRLRLNLDELLGQRFQVKRAQELSIKQASQLIDELNGNKEGG